MSVSDKIKALLYIRKQRQKDVAAYYSISEQAFRNKLFRDSFSASDLIKLGTFFKCRLAFVDSKGDVLIKFEETDIKMYKDGIE